MHLYKKAKVDSWVDSQDQPEESVGVMKLFIHWYARQNIVTESVSHLVTRIRESGWLAPREANGPSWVPLVEEAKP